MKTSLRWKFFVSPGWDAADEGNSFHYHPLNAWVRRALFSIKLVDNNAPCLQKKIQTLCQDPSEFSSNNLFNRTLSTHTPTQSGKIRSRVHIPSKSQPDFPNLI